MVQLGRAALASIALATIVISAAVADQLAIQIGRPVEVSCETQATQVAPTAEISAGTFRVRIDAIADAANGAAGTWTILNRADTHLGSLTERHGSPCKGGCPLYAPPDGKTIELWVPRRTTIDKAAPGELLTIAVIDTSTLKLKASTFLDQQIASLEQGTCKVGD